MRASSAPFVPPHCPNPECPFFKKDNPLWRFVRNGSYRRAASPQRIQRFRCDTCRRRFSTQTFSATYWLRRPDLLAPIFRHTVACAGYRQLARALGVSPQTVLGQVARLGRHCLLFHEAHRPRALPGEPLALDSFESFEYSQDHPTSFHVVAGQRSHFFHGFTESELRRKGKMTRAQRRRRERLETALGRPDPRSVEDEVVQLLCIVTESDDAFELHSDEHPAYARAVRRLAPTRVDHRTVSSRAARTPQNPLFPINLLDLLIRHSSANHKRETIAFSKRRQSAIERLWIVLVWRNYVKSFSERRPGASPAMRLGLVPGLLPCEEILARRYFPGHANLPARWRVHYWRDTPTRRIPQARAHRLKYAS